VVDPNGRYGGPARPSPTITQCLNGGYGWLQVKCRRCETEASIPLEHVRRPRDTIWKLEAALKCRSCRTPRYSPPVNMIRLTEERQTFPTFGCIQTMISKPLSSGLIVSFSLKARLHHLFIWRVEFTILNSFAEYAPEPNPETKKKDVVWIALNDDRPLFAFGGLWTEFKGDRGTKSKPIPGPHLVYGFLTTAPNAVVEPIHPKAMPVILTRSTTSGCARLGMKPRHCSDRCLTRP